MTTSKKIRIRRYGVSPWHFFIENNLSWSFSVKKLGKGGQGNEDVLMADFLNILDFMPLSIIQGLFDKAHGGDKPTFDDPICALPRILDNLHKCKTEVHYVLTSNQENVDEKNVQQ